jgi:hypothetical protein
MQEKYCRNPKCGAPITYGRSDKKFCNASCKSAADRIKNQPTIKKLQYQNIIIKRNDKILEHCFNNINPNNGNPMARIVHGDALEAMGLEENYFRKISFEDIGRLKRSPICYTINYKLTIHPVFDDFFLVIKTSPEKNRKNRR